jgi:hypothetical protein
MVWSVGLSAIIVRTALPTAKALSTARHIVASQNVLIILCRLGHYPQSSLRIDLGG